MSSLPDLHLDFETFSEQDIRKVGGHRYAEDPSTDVCMVNFAIGDEKVVTVDDPRSPELHPFFDLVSKGARVFAHNAQFEHEITSQVATPYYGWPEIKLSQWRCTAARAAAMSLPRSLDMASQTMRVPVVKDPRGKALIQKFCKPQRKGNRLRPKDAPEDWEAFRNYGGMDVMVERSLKKKIKPLTKEEQKIWELDAVINSRGVPVDVDLCNDAISIVEEITGEFQRRCVELTGAKASQRDALLAWLNNHGERLAGLTEPLLSERIKHVQDPEVLEVMKLRLEVGRAGVKKIRTMLDCVSPNGRVRGTLLYHAASTGRWSSMRVQMHNLSKGKVEDQERMINALLTGDPDLVLKMFDRPLTALSKSIRGFIRAQRGRLLCADYSAIEARVLAWVAGELWLIEAFARPKDPQVDVYCMMAASVFGVRVTKADDFKRFIGKQLVLGCGYAMGWFKFVETCARFGQVIEEDFAKKAVDKYRKSVPKIVQVWKDYEKAAIDAIREGKETYVGKCFFYTQGRFLVIELPSGRCLYFLDPSIVEVDTPWGKKPQIEFLTEWRGQLVPERTYGAKLAENIVQAISRDLMANGMLEAEAAGYPVILTVHDEVIAESDGDIKEFSQVICRVPDWGKGIPLTSDGFATERYCKR